MAFYTTWAFCLKDYSLRTATTIKEIAAITIPKTKNNGMLFSKDCAEAYPASDVFPEVVAVATGAIKFIP